MAKGDVETYYENGEWKNKVEGSRRATHVGGTKAERQATGRKMAQSRKVEHIVRKRDGTIGYRDSYGNDPYPPKG